MQSDGQSIAVASRRGFGDVDRLPERWRSGYQLRMDGTQRKPEHFDAEPSGQCHRDINIHGYALQRIWVVCWRSRNCHRCSLWLRADCQSVAIASRRGLGDVDDLLRQLWRHPYQLHMDGTQREPDHLDTEPSG